MHGNKKLCTQAKNWNFILAQIPSLRLENPYILTWPAANGPATNQGFSFDDELEHHPKGFSFASDTTKKYSQRLKHKWHIFNVSLIAPYKLDFKKRKKKFLILQVSIVVILNIPLQKKTSSQLKM